MLQPDSNQRVGPHGKDPELAVNEAPVKPVASAIRKEDDDPIARLEKRVLEPIREKIYLPLNRLIDRLGYVSSVLVLLAVMGGGALAVKIWSNPEAAGRMLTVI